MIHLMCALKCEAKPLIRHFDLRHNGKAKHFPVYISRDQTLSLTVSGIGKTAAAAAVMHTYMLSGGSGTDTWLNVGVAGHPEISRGCAVIANRIIDQGSGRRWYPQILFQPEIPAATIITVDSPSADYREAVLTDMEAAGFYQSVSRIAIAELCHSLKIVSDNNAGHLEEINTSYIAGLISDNLNHIERLLAVLSGLADCLQRTTTDQDSNYDEMISRWHFSRTQRIRLKRLLNRWQILYPGIPVLPDCKTRQNSRTILAEISARLDRAPMRLGNSNEDI